MRPDMTIFPCKDHGHPSLECVFLLLLQGINHDFSCARQLARHLVGNRQDLSCGQKWHSQGEEPPGRAATRCFVGDTAMPGRLLDLLIVHPLERSRHDLARVLAGVEGVGNVSAFDDIAKTSGQRAGIAVVRPVLPLADNGDALRAWSLPSGAPRLIALLAVPEADTVPNLHRAGFSGFLRLDAGVAEFQAAFCAVRQGDVYLSGVLAEAAFMAERESRVMNLPVGLTGREQEILRLIAVNMSNKDIARRLRLSVRTVETHRFHIRKKTRAGNWRELAVVAERLGLLGGYDLYSGGTERAATPGFHED